MVDLRPERALVFRIAHIDNVEWTLENGLYCRNSTTKHPNYREIGNPELILKRANRVVPIAPNGTLSDYIPFYFTPYSPMLLNIKTGYGVPQVPLDEIVIFVTSLRSLTGRGVNAIFTDRHAYLEAAEFFTDLQRLDSIDWRILQNRDFKRDPSDPGKMERYQAEALIHQHLPCEALDGIVCRSDSPTTKVRELVEASSANVQVFKRPSYFI